MHSPGPLWLAGLVLPLEEDWHYGEAADAGGEEAQEDVGRRDQPEGEDVDNWGEAVLESVRDRDSSESSDWTWCVEWSKIAVMAGCVSVSACQCVSVSVCHLGYSTGRSWRVGVLCPASRPGTPTHTLAVCTVQYGVN